MKAKHKLTAVVAAAVMAVSSMPAAVYADSSVHLTRTSIEMEVGEIKPIRLAGASGTITWQIGNSNVFKYKNGQITAVGEGTAYLYATSGGQKYECLVTVRKPMDGICAEDSKLAMKVGEEKQIAVNTDGKDISVQIINSEVCKASCGVIVENKFPLTISGKKKGSATLVIYDIKNPSDKYYVAVTVGDKSSGGKAVKKSTVSQDKYADEIIKLINEERESAGLPTLKKSSTLTESATVRSEEIADNFSHIRPDGTDCYSAVKEKGYKGENIAMGYSTPEEAMEGWTHSPGHMDNILDPGFSKIGVAFNKDANTWVTVFLG